jgi:hypothetical protein
MKAYQTGRPRPLSLISSAASWAAALLIAASIGGLCFLLSGDSPVEFWLLAAPLALIAVVGILRQHSRSRAARRFRAALDAWAEREINRELSTGNGRGTHGRD